MVRCDACAALFWLDDIESVGIMPDAARPIGRLTRAWLRWRGDPEGQLQAQEEWTEAMKSWGQAQHVGRVNFDDVVYVLSRSKGVGRDRLLWLRNCIWWGLNDRYRSRSDGPLSRRAQRSSGRRAVQHGGHPGHSAGWRAAAGQHDPARRAAALAGPFRRSDRSAQAVPAEGHSEVRAVKIERLVRSGDT